MTCLQCGKRFKAERDYPPQKYCSRACGNLHRVQKFRKRHTVRKWNITLHVRPRQISGRGRIVFERPDSETSIIGFLLGMRRDGSFDIRKHVDKKRTRPAPKLSLPNDIKRFLRKLEDRLANGEIKKVLNRWFRIGRGPIREEK